MPLISLLNDHDIKEFDSPKRLTDEERNAVFSLNGLEGMEGMFRKYIIKIGFILQRGYFTMQRKFFVPHQFHTEDIDFAAKLCNRKNNLDISHYKKPTYTKHRAIILGLYGYRSFTEGKKLFENEAKELVRTSLRPKELFHALNEFLSIKKIECPKYYVFAGTIGNALNSFEKDLISLLTRNLSPQQKEILSVLMVLSSQQEGIVGKGPYLITTLKKPAQASTPRKIKESLSDFDIIAELHSEFSKMVEKTGFSMELLNYYAVWIIKAKYVQFESIRDIEKKRLYLIAFILYQYRIRQDLFVDTFLQAIQKYLNDVDNRVVHSFMGENKKEASNKNRLNKLRGIVLSSKGQLDKVRGILFDNKYQDSEKLYLLRELMGYDQRQFHDELLSEITKFENSGTLQLKDDMRFQEMEKGYRRIHNRVAGILRILDFNPDTSDLNILNAVQHYQKTKGKITSRAPMDFISNSEQKRIYADNGEFIPSIYKVILFKEVAHHIKAGSLNLKYSDKYRSIDEYLISKQRWETNKKELMERANIADLDNVHKFLENLKVDLRNQYIRTNENIPNNKLLRFSREGKPLVKTPRIEVVEQGTVSNLFGNDSFLPLITVLSDIRHSTDFIGSFMHYSKRSNKDVPPEDMIYAAIIALGCNIGVRKMGRISKGIGADKLEYSVRWYFSKENIDDANRRIVSLTNELALPSIFKKDQVANHTSSDGQKFNVGVPSLHATYSYKYFGFGKGVSAYSFIDEKSRLFYNTVISASEREAGYVIDGLMHNDGMESSIHSTDTYGYSEIVFGLCNAMGIFFAPRIKNYKDQLIYTFKENPIKYYEKMDFRILPSKNKYIDETILVAQWENILRLLCSIKLKETKSSEVLGRLSSYSKQHPLYKSLKEMGRIFKSIFILRYLDERPLRQGIEKQLNRIEQSHQFAKAVFFGNNQEFKVETKEEQEVAVGCRHLIQNAIVLWNYLFISEKLSEIVDVDEHKKILNAFSNCSIMTWQHINLHGEYDFEIAKPTTSFDLEKILSMNLNTT